MKPSNVVNRMFLLFYVALLLGAFTFSFGNSKVNLNSISKMEGAMKSTALAQEKPSASANADAASPGQDKIKKEFLPGSRINVEDAVKKAPLIIVGKIVDPGIASPDSPDKITYGQVKVEVLQILKGYVSEELSLTFKVYNEPSDMVEKAPQVGQRYIIFIDEKAIYTAIKFLPNTDEQRWHITELVSAAANEHR